MKIQGQTPAATYTKTIALPRPDGSEWILSITPLPLGFHRRLHERGIVSPAPPRRVARDSNGQPLKDRSGLAVMMQDDHDAGYQAEVVRHQQELAALMVFEGLRHDPGIEFETQPPSEGTWQPFAAALCDEFEAAGWSLGDLTIVCEEICRLSNLLDDHLQEAEQVFSSPAPDANAATR